MNHSNDMHESLVLVERIVRPIHAAQSRKLRMRTELLAHLQAAIEEERERFPDDEPAAIEHAKGRLGDPLELKMKLQQTVPTVERLLLARLPMSRRYDRWEQQAALRLYGQRGVMTLGHISILSAMAMLVSGPLLLSLFQMTTVGVPARHLALGIVGMLAGWCALLMMSYRFVFSAASSDDQRKWSDYISRGVIIVGLQIVLTIFNAYAVADRLATIQEAVSAAAPTVALIVVWVAMARRVSVLRRPYDQWLSLDIA